MLHTQIPPTLYSSSAFSPTILVVDESTDTHNLICEMISAAGYATLSARNGNEALECIKTTVPDAVLLDTTSSNIRGFELGRRIKSMPTCTRIPILFMIEQANAEQIINSYENGGADYISKPLRIPEMLARLLTCVTAYPHARQHRASGKPLRP